MKMMSSFLQGPKLSIKILHEIRKDSVAYILPVILFLANLVSGRNPPVA